MDGSQTAENIAAVIALIVGVSLVLSQVLGGLVTYLVEAIKGTGRIADGYSGLVSLGVSVVLGMILLGISDAMAEEPYPVWVMLAIGAFAGSLVAAGSIKTYKAMGDVNTKASATTIVQNAPEQTTGVTIGDYHARETGQELAQIRETPRQGNVQGASRQDRQRAGV